jgi:hypothetical protein|tara:strand:+ start:1989 stop:2348 length:360 start_codon:yes stop_codon:yes gene_type:complete
MYKKTTTIKQLHNKFTTTAHPACKHLQESMGLMGFDLWEAIVNETYDRGGGFDILLFSEDHPHIHDLITVFFELEDMGFCQIHQHAVLGTAFVYFMDVIKCMYALSEYDLIGYLNEGVN